jgi:hypothetical protein
MRVMITVMLLGLLTLPALAADQYGEKLSDGEVVAISALLDQPDEYVGKTVKIEGRITGVCAHRGCWIEVAGDQDFQSMRVKVEDGVIVFPAEAVGHVATAEGVFTKIELTPEQTEAMHKATCTPKQGESCQHGAAKEGGVVYQLAGLGALID